jgi:hypothetical protein
MMRRLIIILLLFQLAGAVDVKTLDTSWILRDNVVAPEPLRPSGDLQGMVDVQTIMNAHKYTKPYELYVFDCVDTTIACGEVLTQHGYKVAYMIQWHNDTVIKGHVYPIVYLKNGWVAVDTTAFMDKVLGRISRNAGLLQGQVVSTIEDLKRIDRETLKEEGGPEPPEYNLSEVITLAQAYTI